MFACMKGRRCSSRCWRQPLPHLRSFTKSPAVANQGGSYTPSFDRKPKVRLLKERECSQKRITMKKITSYSQILAHLSHAFLFSLAHSRHTHTLVSVLTIFNGSWFTVWLFRYDSSSQDELNQSLFGGRGRRSSTRNLSQPGTHELLRIRRIGWEHFNCLYVSLLSPWQSNPSIECSLCFKSQIAGRKPKSYSTIWRWNFRTFLPFYPGFTIFGEDAYSWGRCMLYSPTVFLLISMHSTRTLRFLLRLGILNLSSKSISKQWCVLLGS